MFRRNPDVIAILAVLLWTLFGQTVRPVIPQAPMAGMRLIVAPFSALRCLALPSINLHLER